MRRSRRAIRADAKRSTLALSLMLLAACSFDETHARCRDRQDCAANERCVETFCVPDRGATRDRSDGASREPDAGSPNEPMSADESAASNRSSGRAPRSEPGSMPPPAAGGDEPGGSGGAAAGTTAASAGAGPSAGEAGGKPGGASGHEAGRGGSGAGAAGSAGAPGAAGGNGAANGGTSGGACSGDESRDCYDGPDGTLGVGACRAGRERCTGGAFGPCTDAVRPGPEHCQNPGVDDDCNGRVDDVPGLGSACEASSGAPACGAGKLGCQPGSDQPVCTGAAQPSAESCNDLDDDCDGKIDETFQKQTDPLHCGSCNHECASGESCCEGRCVNTRDDPNHCGGCGVACTGAQAPACCSGNCTDLVSDGNCGACGNDCGLLGVLCLCQRTEQGIACVAPLGLCL